MCAYIRTVWNARKVPLRMLLTLLLAAALQPTDQTVSLPPTSACDRKRQADRDQFAISHPRFASHPASSAASDYWALSDRLAEAMRAAAPDLVLIRNLSRELAHRRLDIEAKASLARLDCNLDMIELSPPSARTHALKLIAPPTTEERKNPKSPPPPGPYIDTLSPPAPVPRPRGS